MSNFDTKNPCMQKISLKYRVRVYIGKTVFTLVKVCDCVNDRLYKSKLKGEGSRKTRKQAKRYSAGLLMSL